MGSGRISFTKHVIGELDNSPYTDMNTFLAVGDMNRDGRVDIVVAGRDGEMVWFENPGPDGAWQRHELVFVSCMD